MSTDAVTRRRPFQFGVGALLLVITMVTLLVFAFRERSLRLHQAAEAAVHQAQLINENRQLSARLTTEERLRQSLQHRLRTREDHTWQDAMDAAKTPEG